MWSARDRRILLIVYVSTAVVAAVWTLAWSTGLGLHGPFVTSALPFLGFCVTIAAAATAIITANANSRAATSAEAIAKIETNLRAKVAIEHRDNRRTNNLLPVPIDTAWSEASSLSGKAEDILGDLEVGRAVNLRLRSSLNQVAATFDRLPRRQLVVIGPPGSGKSVLLIQLAHELDQGPGAVPVILSLSSWEPSEYRDVRRWLRAEIARRYPDLFHTSAQLQSLHILLDEHRILPLLDGLDEMPEQSMREAIRGLRDTLRDLPVVIACREQEFADLITDTGGPLPTAAVIALQPVDAADVLSYLENRNPPLRSAWRRLFSDISSDDNSPVSEALTSPLNVGLAQTIYSTPGKDPAELSDRLRFKQLGDVTDYLLSAYIPAAYDFDDVSSIHDDSAAAKKYRRAARYRYFIAHSMTRVGPKRDFEWWSIPHLLPKAWSRSIYVLFCGLVGVVVGWYVCSVVLALAYPWVIAIASGAATATAAAIPAIFGNLPGEPVHMSAHVETTGGLRETIRSGMVIGLPCGLIFGGVAFAAGISSIPATFIGLTALLLGALFGGLIRWSLPIERARINSPASILQIDLRSTMVRVVAVFVLTTVLLALLFRVFSDGLGASIGAAAICGASLAVGALISCPWTWYQVAKIYFWTRGNLPLRLIRFLDEERARGVMRMVGSVYQFKHANLQDYILRTPPTST